jgi:hypothetical protein
MDKRYQVFISSTYADLQEERREVIQTVMKMDCIPAGMELFPAVDEEQFKFIQRTIDDCDYYLLIIGGRYGTVTAEGISYTEKEYDYAVDRGLKVIALIHENPDEIPLGKSEKDPLFQEKLRKFREKVSAGRLVSFWKSASDLPGLVALNLQSTMKLYPAVGWIRANKAANEDVLAEINDLRKENAQLHAKVAELTAQPTVENLAGLQDKMELEGRYRDQDGSVRYWIATLSWADIFGSISPYLIDHPDDDDVQVILAEAAFRRAGENGTDESLDDQQFRTVAVQLQALGLVKLQKYDQGLFWSPTPSGERLNMELRTVKKNT